MTILPLWFWLHVTVYHVADVCWAQNALTLGVSGTQVSYKAYLKDCTLTQVSLL
jgi:hypothetical protein